MEIMTYTQRKSFSRSPQFQYMERIVRAMQDPTTGVRLREQKLFLTRVPNVFTGGDMLQWIMEKLNVKNLGR